MNQPAKWDLKFAEWLQGLKERQDRATLAALRRGLTMEPEAAVWMLRYMPPWLLDGLREQDEPHVFFVAALFAWHPEPWSEQPQEGEPTNLGASLARLVAKERSRTGEAPASVEARFEALLNSHPEDLPEHLRRIIGLLRSKEVPVNWARLLHDLRQWGWGNRIVQREWARAFWRSAAAAS